MSDITWVSSGWEDEADYRAEEFFAGEDGKNGWDDNSLGEYEDE